MVPPTAVRSGRGRRGHPPRICAAGEVVLSRAQPATASRARRRRRVLHILLITTLGEELVRGEPECCRDRAAGASGW